MMSVIGFVPDVVLLILDKWNAFLSLISGSVFAQRKLRNTLRSTHFPALFKKMMPLWVFEVTEMFPTFVPARRPLPLFSSVSQLQFRVVEENTMKQAARFTVVPRVGMGWC